MTTLDRRTFLGTLGVAALAARSAWGASIKKVGMQLYTVRGDLVRTLNHDSPTEGFEAWNLRTEDNLDVAPGLYVFHVDAPGLGTRMAHVRKPMPHHVLAPYGPLLRQRIIGYSMLDPTQPKAAELVREGVQRDGLRGVTLFPAMHHFHAYDERLHPLYQAATDLKIPVFVHFGVLKVSIRDKLGLPNVFDLRYADPIDLHRAAIDFPRVNFIIPHFGCGYLREALMLGAQAPNVYLDTSSSNTWLTYMPSHLDLKTVFEKALQVFGPQRLLFGTDSNVFPRGWRQDILHQQMEILRDLQMPQEAAAQILGGNIARLLGRS